MLTAREELIIDRICAQQTVDRGWPWCFFRDLREDDDITISFHYYEPIEPITIRLTEQGWQEVTMGLSDNPFYTDPIEAVEEAFKLFDTQDPEDMEEDLEFLVSHFGPCP